MDKIVFILFELAIGAVLAYLSMLFIEKVYLKMKPKDIDERPRARREKIFISICAVVGLSLVFGLQVMMIVEKIVTWEGLLMINAQGAILISLTILALRNRRVQKWLGIK